jgi:hypothetical protein
MSANKFENEYQMLIEQMESQMNEPENDRFIISDGVMKPEHYFANEIRLAWMLKEPYDGEEGTGGGWSYFDMFPEGKNLYEEQFKRPHKSTWHPIIYTSYSIYNDFLKFEDMEYIRDKNEMCDIVRQVAFVNAQKLPSKGQTSTNHEDIWESINKNGNLLTQQVELLNPNVLVFANTIKFYEKLLDLNFEELKNAGTCQYLIKDNKIYIDAYHPAQKIHTSNVYVNDIVDIVKKWKAGEL